MDLETSQELRRLRELVEENNKMLKHMQSRARWAIFFSSLKWVVFVGIAIGSYFVVQPYIDQTMKLYGALQQTQVDSQGIMDYLKNFGNSIKYTLPR